MDYESFCKEHSTNVVFNISFDVKLLCFELMNNTENILLKQMLFYGNSATKSQ